jgi:ADP-ribose pyrophosphatase YjhB (NUDIX family)
MAHVPRFCAQCGATLVERIVDGRTRHVCPACGTVAYVNPLPVASALVLNEKREVLLVRRNREPQQGQWCLPIGFAEMGETIAEAARRELREEAGIEGRVLSLLDVDSYESDFYGDLLIVTYQFEKTGGREQPGDDAEAAAYFPLDALPELAFPANRRAVTVCRDLHADAWAIRDSFVSLQETHPSAMVSDALVAVLRDHAEEIAALWLADVRHSLTTPSYHHADTEDLRGNAVTALAQFGRWLGSGQVEGEIRAFYRRLGRQRCAEGFGLHEVLSSLMLLRKHIYASARGHGVWERPLDAYRVLELDRRLVLFFDRAMYHVARGFAGGGAPA